MIIPLKIDRVEGAAGEEAQGLKDVQESKKGVCVPQWSMVELQGELISKNTLSGQSLGSMKLENVSRRGAVPQLQMRGRGVARVKRAAPTRVPYVRSVGRTTSKRTEM